MPPLRSGRASKACDLCRKNKTRCYASDKDGGACLRCQTQCQACSLEVAPTSISQPPRHHNVHSITANYAKPAQPNSVHERLDRLERSVGALLDRLDAGLLADGSENLSSNQTHSSAESDDAFSAGRDPAPVLLIREAATDAGVHSPDVVTANSAFQRDVISSGLIAVSDVHSLIQLFQIHYGRWVKFSEDLPSEALLAKIRKSPLLLCSALLIAIRHTTQEMAGRLAPKLFEEAKHLIASSLLMVPQPVEFFQATLILSLWSTTIGQVPLSIDSWLLTGYTIQQALASPEFARALYPGSILPPASQDLDDWCIWNHICLAHLQYCIGTRRQAVLSQGHIDHCIRIVDVAAVSNFEQRMAAEVELYWLIYKYSRGPHIDLSETQHALQEWQKEWTSLLNQPRSQFLEMGFHFGNLLAYFYSLRLPRSVMSSSILSEMVRLSKSIINIAIDTADERSRHLSDHIYHIVTFSALTLCRLLHTYESKLLMTHHDVASLDNLILKLIIWLRSIGLPCHAAHMLGDIVASQFKKQRPNCQTDSIDIIYSLANGEGASPLGENEMLPTTIAFLYPDFMDANLFSVDSTVGPWPQWG